MPRYGRLDAIRRAPHDLGMERLNKVLAHAGVASRRNCDEIVRAGRVTVNGAIVTEPGTQVDPGADEIRFDGERVAARAPKLRYLALFKPRDVLTTVSDPEGRPTVMDLVPRDVRLYPVGRLDGASEGLILLTNDGELANRLAHPRHAHEKEYRVKVSGTPNETALAAWRDGVWLDDGRTAPCQVRLESTTGAGTWLRFVLRQGKNRQIRRMVEAFHHRVHRLVRVRIGPITLGDLKPGHWRELGPTEVAALRGDQAAQATLARAQAPRAARKPKYKAGWARPKPPAAKPGHGPWSATSARGKGRRRAARGGGR